MKIIQKKISLEQFKSRLDGVIPSYPSNCETYNTFSDGNGNTNYNLIPMSVKWEYGTEFKNSVLSYNTISSWFHFLIFYINLLSNNGCSKSNYNTAKEYFRYESSEYSMEECEEFDEKVKIICGDGNYNSSVEVYNYMAVNFFPTFETIGVRRNVSKRDSFSSDEGEVESYLKIPIQLTVNIDNLGEMSIFCKDWEAGVKYYRGDIIRYEDKDWVFNGDNELGSDFDEEIYESSFSHEKYTITNNQSSDTGKEISGYTESKLSSFILSTEIGYDNLGNRLPGIITSTIHDGYKLGLPYKADTAIHLTKLNDDDVYFCDYLKSISELDDNNSCTFTYYMGCTLKKVNNSEYNWQILDEGVKYVDTVKLIEKECKYYLDELNFYMVKYDDIEHENINYKNDSNDYNSVVGKAKFSFTSEGVNNFTDFPLIRMEYAIGASSLQNIESDIYINRGTARSFDYHLKLMEVNSLESLEQYGNGFFNIINN